MFSREECRKEFIEVRERIAPYIHNTPVMTSSYLDELSGAHIYFKGENFQKMGAFKMRGAANAALSLSEEQRAKGLVTHSSGNFAQAVALTAKSLGIPAYIVMPSNAPQSKINAVKSYGGKVTICEPTMVAREAAAKYLIDEHGASFLHPSNQLEVIMGQGTAAVELIEEVNDLDILMVPVGGGGLLAGTALAANGFANGCKTIGCEPMNVDDAYRSFKSGKIESNDSVDTIADGLRTTLGDVNFPIIMEHVDRIIRVSEEEIKVAMKLIWERMKIIVEPSSAVPFAALLSNPDEFKNKKIGIILSGGNVDFGKIPFV